MQGAFGTPRVKVEQRWAWERQHGNARHEGVRQGHPGISTAGIGDRSDGVAKQADKRISREILAFFGNRPAHNEPLMMRTAKHAIVCVSGVVSHHGLRQANGYLGVVTGGRGLPGIAVVCTGVVFLVLILKRFEPITALFEQHDTATCFRKLPCNRAAATSAANYYKVWDAHIYTCCCLGVTGGDPTGENIESGRGAEMPLPCSNKGSKTA